MHPDSVLPYRKILGVCGYTHKQTFLCLLGNELCVFYLPDGILLDDDTLESAVNHPEIEICLTQTVQMKSQLLYDNEKEAALRSLVHTSINVGIDICSDAAEKGAVGFIVSGLPKQFATVLKRLY